MFLQKVYITDFKNYSEAELEFCDKINCFVGRNGAGKTNLLDAIHYLSFCKSYFNPIDQQNIRHNALLFTLHGTYFKNGNQQDLVSCIQERDQKKVFRMNKKTYGRLADHIGLFPLVMVSPYDRDLINDGSEIRRKYTDSVISQFDRVYLDDLIQYNKALLQRNTLLKTFAEQRYFDGKSLEIWDEQLINLGRRIYIRRKEFIDHFIPIFRHYFEFISRGNEKVDIGYDSQLHGRDSRELLRASRDKDLAARFTTAGVHKDDLNFTIGDHPLKKFGSQGQQKSFVVAIKLAQFDYTRDIKGFKPILLLDDIFDKLDETRVEQIVRLVSENSFGQVFITDTQQDRIMNIMDHLRIEHRIFRVDNGTISRLAG
ncbi:MAG TPA: DNA replication/repair protein RecF [Bacteroidales bacterium]|nr:DNA replication/repair protein RecF [Bacteroidales bacterium]HNS46021.1 DNA replication/repair protein RecF [Bacteroidales bacterium]